MPTTASKPTAAKLVINAEAPRIDVMGIDVRPHVLGSESAGNIAMFTLAARPGDGVPPHYHTREEEIFHVVEGQLRVVVAGVEYIAGPNDTAFLPRNVLHEWWVHGDKPARCVLILTPAGMEHYFPEIALQQDGTRPSIEEIIAISAKYGIIFPPPQG